MKWDNSYDDKSIEYQEDKYGHRYYRISRVAWATKDSHNRPKLLDGVVIGFNRSPSFINTFIKTSNNRIVKKDHSQLIVII